MGWTKLLFYFIIIYFNVSLLRTNILLGIGLIALEVIIFGKMRGGGRGSSSKSGRFYKRDNGKIEKLLNILIMIELMKMENNPASRGREDPIIQPALSDSHKKIMNTFGKNAFFSNTSPKIELSEHSDISALVTKYYENKDFHGIIRSFLGLIRLLSKTLIFQLYGNFNPRKNIKKCYPFFDKLGRIFQSTYNLNYLSDKLNRLKIIEIRTKNSANELSSKILQEDAEFLINLYFSLKNFKPQVNTGINNQKKYPYSKNIQYLNPIISSLAKKNGNSFFKWGGNSQMLIPESFKPILQQFIDNKFKLEHDRIKSDLYHSGNLNQAISDFEEISFTREPIEELKIKSRSSDPIDNIKYECFRKFLLGFAGFIGLCGGLMMAQISYLPEASGYFQSSGIMFFIVSAVSVYISRKI